MIGWLVNDLLTAIPGTKTFWHHLLEWIPGLENRTGTPFCTLAEAMEQEATYWGPPSYIIRNASYFRPMDIAVPTISLLQDVQEGPSRALQLAVCRRSSRVVVNSKQTLLAYPELAQAGVATIPLGVDFDFFRPGLERIPEIDPNSILFVGAANDHPKGFDRLRALIAGTDFPFVLVLKDGAKYDHPRVKIFNRVDAVTMARIYNSCKLLVCTSREETQHLAGIEAAACGLPIVAMRVGVYADLAMSRPRGWGCVVNHPDELEGAVKHSHRLADAYRPRESLEPFFGLGPCRKAWQELIGTVTLG